MGQWAGLGTYIWRAVTRLRVGQKVLASFALAGAITIGSVVFASASAEATGYEYTPPLFGSLSLAVGVAVDNSSGGSAGDVYVADLEGHVVDKFNATGEPVDFTEGSGAGTNQLTGTEEEEHTGKSFSPWDVAVDRTTGDFYVTSETGFVAEFESTGKFIQAFSPPVGATPDGAFNPTGIAIDNSGDLSDPSNGDVYVSDHGSNVVDKFSPTGEYISQLGAGTQAGELVTPDTLAVDASGNVYVVSRFKNVHEYGSAGEAKGVFAENESQSITIDPSTGDIFVKGEANSEGFVDQYNSAGTLLDQFGEGTVQSAYSIAVNASTHVVYVSEINLGAVRAFDPIVEESPTEVSTAPATEVKLVHAQLGGQFNPGGHTRYYFEYGTAPCNEVAKTCGTKTAVHGPVVGKTLQTVPGLEVTDLTPGTTYHYWIVATNSAETVDGQEETFTTETGGKPTEVVTEPATEIKATSAELNGKLNPVGHATYYFAYGTEQCSAMGCSTHTAEAGPIVSESQQTVAGQEVGSLTPQTTYHFWIVATNGAGTTYGTELSFTPGAKVRTEPAEDVTETSAYLSGEMDPNGLSLNYYYEYGAKPCAATSCGTKTSEEGPEAGEAWKVLESAFVSSLSPATVYHYWIVVSNGQGSVHGAERTFTTEGKPPPVETPTKPSESTSGVKGPEKTESHGSGPTTPPTVAIVKVKASGAKMLVTVKVSEQGAVRIAGAGLMTISKSVDAGSHTFDVALTKKGKAERKHHKSSKITVTLKVGSETVSASKKVAL